MPTPISPKITAILRKLPPEDAEILREELRVDPTTELLASSLERQAAAVERIPQAFDALSRDLRREGIRALLVVVAVTLVGNAALSGASMVIEGFGVRASTATTAEPVEP